MTDDQTGSAPGARTAAHWGWRLYLLLYPFTLMAVWINLFMLGLLAIWVGLPSLSAPAALFWALFVALPANWAAARWVHRLLERARED
ncbi:MAG: hypothetical protein ACK5LJ_01705 [Paracoccus sp. (in: a-proteobacteria)]